MTPADVDRLDWAKQDGLLPAIVQHAGSGEVLMLGYMDAEALRATLATGRATFYSRGKRRLWTKGETSGHYLHVTDVVTDCDRDALLVKAHPAGPTCHNGTSSCFAAQQPTAAAGVAFLAALEQVVAQRIAERPEGSYTARVYARGTGRLAQKVGEEGVEVALAAVGGERGELIGESADLLFHLLLLLKSRGLGLADVVAELEARHAARTQPEADPPP